MDTAAPPTDQQLFAQAQGMADDAIAHQFGQNVCAKISAEAQVMVLRGSLSQLQIENGQIVEAWQKDAAAMLKEIARLTGLIDPAVLAANPKPADEAAAEEDAASRLRGQPPAPLPHADAPPHVSEEDLGPEEPAG